MRKSPIFIIVVLLLDVITGAYYYKKYNDNTMRSSRDPDSIRIASWNIRIFSNNSRDDTELQQICDVLIDYDFVAILELRDEEILQRAKAMLLTMGRDYDYQISGQVGRNVKERYAFLYDATIVTVVEPGRIFPDPDDLFIREPYYATFQSDRFDFTIIATHVIWGNRVANRKAEIKHMAEVFQQIQDMDPSEQDIILVGDFNREPKDTKSFQALLDIPTMAALFSAPQKSHIKDSSLYDNIWLQLDYANEYTGVSGIDKFDETDFGNDDEAANLAVSDHRPVWAEFHRRFDDDGVEVAAAR